MDKLGTKKSAKVIHNLYLPSKGFHTDLVGCNKAFIFKWLRRFSTEIAETITTSF